VSLDYAQPEVISLLEGHSQEQGQVQVSFGHVGLQNLTEQLERPLVPTIASAVNAVHDSDSTCTIFRQSHLHLWFHIDNKLTWLAECNSTFSGVLLENLDSLSLRGPSENYDCSIDESSFSIHHLSLEVNAKSEVRGCTQKS
jgi:hypothetical protein